MEEPEQDPPSAEDAVVSEICERYLEDLRSGHAPNRVRIAEAHPAISERLQRRLALIELLFHVTRRGLDTRNSPSHPGRPTQIL